MSRWVACALGILTAAGGNTGAVQRVADGPPGLLTLMTTVTNARLRAEPSTTAPVLATLAIGSEVIAIPSVPGPGWRRVSTNSGRVGWIQTDLLRIFDVTERSDTVAAIVEPRLPAGPRSPRLPGTDIDARRQVSALLERTMILEADRERRAHLSWLYIRALGAVLDALPNTTLLPEEDRAWLNAHAPVVQESIGFWIVRPAFIQDLHTRFSDAATADDIAWYLAEQGLGGECEGDVPCYVFHSNGTFGEYLRWHQAGRRATEAVTAVASRLSSNLDHLQRFPSVFAEFTRSRCGELALVLNPLRESVERANASTEAKQAALQTLRRYAALCN